MERTTEGFTHRDYRVLRLHRENRRTTREEMGAPTGLIPETYSRARRIARTPERAVTFATHEVSWMPWRDPYGRPVGDEVVKHGLTVRLAGFGHAPFGRIKSTRPADRIREARVAAPDFRFSEVPTGLVVLDRAAVERAIIGPIGSAE